MVMLPFKPAQECPVSAARLMLAHSSPLWPRILRHPFVHAVADGSLDHDAFARWVVADHSFNVEYRRFIAGLITIAPTSWDAEVIAEGLPTNKADIELLRQVAVEYEIDLDVDPGPTAVGFSAYLHSLLQRGYEVALAALYSAEIVYYDGWKSVRGRTSSTTPYWPFVQAWSSQVFADWIEALSKLVDAAAPDGPTAPMYIAFDRTVRFELLFWTGIYAGDTW